jgi:hypothetical protein
VNVSGMAFAARVTYMYGAVINMPCSAVRCNKFNQFMNVNFCSTAIYFDFYKFVTLAIVDTVLVCFSDMAK